MRHRTIVQTLIASMILAALCTTAISAGNVEPSDPETFFVQFRIIHPDGPDSAREFRLSSVAGGGPVSLEASSRVPIPDRSFDTQSKAGETESTTKFTFHNVGFNADVRTDVNADGRVRVRGKVSDSYLDFSERKQSIFHRPITHHFSQSVDVIVDIGAPIEVLRFTDTQIGNVSLTMTVTRDR